MTSPVLALRAAVRRTLLLDAALLTLLGGEKIHDEAPRTTEPPYVVFGEADARDRSTADSKGHEHRLSLRVTSDQQGDAEALAITGRMADVLENASITIDGHRLVLLAVAAEEMTKPGRDGRRRAVLRLTALTEKL